ncbi:MAG: hypothetical protein GX862_07340 [Leucobacter sp.]|nr:hypothetical protein [Leucobacter sp.]
MTATRDITFACGHTETRDLAHKPAGDRARFAEWLASTKCSSCFKQSSKRKLSAEVTKERAAVKEAALAEQARFKLPTLTGSDKQCAWALTVRSGLLRAVYEDRVQSGDMDEEAFDEQVLQPTRQIDYAGWWIDNREATSDTLLELIADPGDKATQGSTENPY